MARFSEGWIKLNRKLLDSDVSQNIWLFGIWNWFLLAATRTDSSIIWDGARRDIPAGTVIFGLKELADKWGCSRSTIQKWVKYLAESERIAYDTCTRGCIVTIRNWSLYQENQNGTRTQREHGANTECTRGEHGVALIGEDKKEEEDKIRVELASPTHPLYEIWNANRKRLPEAERLTAKRKRLCSLRWKEDPDREYWAAVVNRIALSDFCNGKNDRAWIATFDFLLRPDTHAKAMEGLYDNRSTSIVAGVPISAADFLRELKEKEPQ